MERTDQCYLTRVIAYYDSDYAAHLRQPVFEVAAELLDHGFAHAGYESSHDEISWLAPDLAGLVVHQSTIVRSATRNSTRHTGFFEAGVRQSFEGKAVPSPCHTYGSYI